MLLLLLLVLLLLQCLVWYWRLAPGPLLLLMVYKISD